MNNNKLNSNTHKRVCNDENSESEHAPIFVIGGGRSGTTLMRYMLNAHPNIYIVEECSFYTWTKIPPKWASLEKKLSLFFRSFSFAWLGINASDIVNSIQGDSQTSKLRSAFVEVMKSKAKQNSRKRFGEKNPLNIFYLKELFDDFPDAKVIHVVRDPRAQVFAHTTVPFSTPSLLIANHLINENFKKVAKFDQRILSIKLEDLVKEPEEKMREVLSYLGEPWSDKVMHHDQHVIPNDGIPFPWLQEASRSRKSKKKSWKHALTPAWIRLIENVNKKNMQRFNYEPMVLKREPSRVDRLKAILMDCPIVVSSLLRVIGLTYKLCVTPKTETEKLQALLHNVNPDAWDLHPEWNKDLPAPPPVNW